MPISNEVKVTPTTGEGSGPAVVIPDGIYDVELTDITFIPGEQNQFSGKPQLKMVFKILAGEHKDVELRSWVSMTMNPGWEQGSPSHLYSISKAIMMEEPDLEADFYPNVLVGGKLRVFVEEKTSKKGTKYSKVSKYLAPSTTVEQDVVQEKELKKKPKTEDEEIAESLAESDEEVPF